MTSKLLTSKDIDELEAEWNKAYIKMWEMSPHFKQLKKSTKSTRKISEITPTEFEELK